VVTAAVEPGSLLLVLKDQVDGGIDRLMTPGQPARPANATISVAQRWYNTSRLMHRLGRRPPAEAEAEYYAGRGSGIEADDLHS